ncbi:Rieske (2Fe-2S) protein [soil metagenome]
MCVALGGLGFAASLLESCSTVPLIKASADNYKVSVPLKSFTKEKSFVIVRVASLDHDILLVKNSDGKYLGLNMVCTHQSQPLSLSGNGLHCSAHGSSFDLEGNVTHAPAAIPLKRYTATLSGESIIIDLQS